MSDPLVASLAASQLGVFARFQLLELAIYPNLIKRRLQAGLWTRLAPGVYGIPGYPDSWARRLWVAYLAAGRESFVSHEASASCFGTPGFPQTMLSVMVLHPQHQRVAGAVVHQTRFLPRHHWISLYGRRTTTFARTLVDLAATTSLVRLDHAYEHGILNDHVSHARMAKVFVELFSPGRKGMMKLGSILDERGPGFVAAASELERMLFDCCGRVGLTPVRQYPHPGREFVNGCVDGALVEAKLILEADGRRWHNRLQDQARDRARDKAAGRAGWQTMRFCHEELTHDPEGEAQGILETYQQRVRLLPASP